MVLRVMVEFRLLADIDPLDEAAMLRCARDLGVTPDPELAPVPMQDTDGGRQIGSIIVTGTVADQKAIECLRRDPQVIEVWQDGRIAPFTS